MGRHLEEQEVEALAHGRADLLDDALRLHVNVCEECAAMLVDARLATRVVVDALEGSLPPLHGMEALIQSAIQRAETESAPAPSLRKLALAGCAASVAAVALSLFEVADGFSLPSIERAFRDVISIAMAVDRVVAVAIPGGWTTFAFLAAVSLLLLYFPLRRLLTETHAANLGGPFLMSLIVLLSFLAFSGGARAIDFEGTWPADEQRITLDLEERTPAEIVRHAASVLGLEFVHTTLPTDRRSIVLEDASLQEVLETLFPDDTLVALRTEDLLVIRRASNRASDAAEEPDVAGIGVEPSSGAEDPSNRGPPEPPVIPGVPIPETTEDNPPGAERDRFSAGGNVYIRRGERVRNVSSWGGNVVIDGIVTGDVTTVGGNVEIRSGAEVYGELVTVGGNIDIADDAIVYDAEARVIGGNVDGQSWEAPDPNGWQHSEEGRESFWLREVSGSAVRYLVLFVLGLIIMGAAPRRFGAVRRTIEKRPVRSLITGLIGFPVAALVALALCITVIGVPVAAVVVIGGALATMIGTIASAHLIGTSLPLRRLNDRPVLQLAVGVFLLFLVSRVPGIGGFAVFIAASIGFGATLATRFRPHTQFDLVS